MRLDRHPGIVFRDGAAGRRAVVVGGPDVWEVIAAARSAPERGEELIRALSERTGVAVEKIRIAIRYYAEYPGEVDRSIAANEEEAEQLERACGGCRAGASIRGDAQTPGCARRHPAGCSLHAEAEAVGRDTHKLTRRLRIVVSSVRVRVLPSRGRTRVVRPRRSLASFG
jgi:hypothetical protein